MAETRLDIVFLSLFFIAGIVFLSKPLFSVVSILILVFLAPRAGFLVSTNWKYPLPLGYIFVVFLMAKWFLHLLFVKKKRSEGSPIDKVFPFYVIVSVVAIIVGVINNGDINTMVLETFIYFLAFFIFFMVLDLFDNERCVKVFITGSLICGAMISLYGILLLIFGQSILIEYLTYTSSNYKALLGQFIMNRRTISSYGDPNTLSAQLMVFASIFASLLLMGKYRSTGKILLFAGLILTVLCIYFASSRASLMGLFVLSMILAMTRVKKLWFYVPILTISYFIFLEPIRKYYEHRIYTTGITSDMRITYLKLFLDLFVRYPFGVGFGCNIDEKWNIIPAGNVWLGFNSFYIHIFSRIGIQGVVLFCLMLFLIIKYLFTGLRYIKDVNTRYYVFGAACGIIVQQFNFIANNVYHVPGGMLNFWIMCGMLTIIINRSRSRDNTAS
ncbi:MAG: O-antigen ligase family protein [Candidatus Omnitrophota bacterium]